MTEEEVRRQVSYHRSTHRVALFSAKSGTVRQCKLPTCQAFVKQLDQGSRALLTKVEKEA